MPPRDLPPKKTLIWIGSSRRDLIAMPVPLRKEFGVALDIAQQGLAPAGAKLLKGKAEGAIQLSEDHHGDTYRAVYTIELENCLYVLHCFQKKSKKGAETPKSDLDLIATRLKTARALHAERLRKNR
jgi:phage-related protein